jgi:hypothetical protein
MPFSEGYFCVLASPYIDEAVEDLDVMEDSGANKLWSTSDTLHGSLPEVEFVQPLGYQDLNGQYPSLARI